MDAKTRKELGRITANVPEKLAANITREEVDVSEEEILVDYLKNGNPSPQARRMIEKGIRDGKFRSSETVENEKTVKELDRYYTWAIRKSMRKGLLTDPSKDGFVRDRLAKMRKHGMKI